MGWSIDSRGEQKKLKNRLNRENWKKNNRKNRTAKKNRLQFWKNRPVRFCFDFISLKPKKPNRTQTKKTRKKTESNWKKPSQTEKIESNRFELVFDQKTKSKLKPVDLNQFWFFLKKNLIWFFLIKIKLNKKKSSLIDRTQVFFFLPMILVLKNISLSCAPGRQQLRNLLPGVNKG
jgi:hypothetical protein